MGKKKSKKKNETDWAAFTQPIFFDSKATDRFSKEDLEMPDYSEDDSDIEYKPEFIWSLDHTLAIFLDKTLTAFMNYDYTAPPDDIKRARDAFRAYARKDDGEFNMDNPFPFETLGSPEHNELMWALKWLRKNFSALWT